MAAALETVQRLLAAGAEVNVETEGGETALMKAGANNHTDMVQCLLAAGAEVNVQDEGGETALMKAAADE